MKTCCKYVFFKSVGKHFSLFQPHVREDVFAMADMLSTLVDLFTLYGCLKIQPQIGRKEKSAVLYFFPVSGLIDSDITSASKIKCPCVPVNTQHLF